METNLPVLHVNMFGNEKITYGDCSILLGRGNVTKVMKLLLILLFRGRKGITRKRLLEDLYEGEEIANVANNLRVTMHRLKKMLVESGLPEHEYIIYKEGSYYWDCPMEMDVDTVRFEKLLESAGQEESDEVKIDCYIGMNRYKDALKEYKATARLLFEELGVKPSEQMEAQFEEMSRHITNRPQMIGEIQNDLREKREEHGAFYCTVPGFRDAYRVVNRGMERNGQSVFLLVCTLVDKKGRPMEQSEKLKKMADELCVAIKCSLRRCDVFTKYNQSQFLVMLLGTKEENCQLVIRRIRDAFSCEHKSWASHLECSVASFYQK